MTSAHTGVPGGESTLLFGIPLSGPGIGHERSNIFSFSKNKQIRLFFYEKKCGKKRLAMLWIRA
jgi:hypothetical protein